VELKSKYASSLLVEVGYSPTEEAAQTWLDQVSSSVDCLKPIEVLAIAYETLQSTPYRSAEQDSESAYHIARALREINLAMGKTAK
jgi:hypothetical protein